MSSSVGVTGDSDTGKSLSDMCLQKNRPGLLFTGMTRLNGESVSNRIPFYRFHKYNSWPTIDC